MNEADQEWLNERDAILEFEANQPRKTAELLARVMLICHQSQFKTEKATLKRYLGLNPKSEN